MQMTVGKIAEILDIDAWKNCASLVTGVSIDSRETKSGDLFVCIPGEHSDGHAYALQAKNNGAVAILAEQALSLASDYPVLYCPNTVVALGKIASDFRAKTKAKVIAITGTAGKTTARQMLSSCLAIHGSTASSPRNYNSQIGLPLAILNCTGQEDFWVMEIGISKENDMDELGQIIRPDLAIILNVGAGHFEGLGSKGVAHHKAKLLAYLNKDGEALVCADYPELVREVRMIMPSSKFFSIQGKPVTYRGSYFGHNSQKGLYKLWLDGQVLDVETIIRGSYAAENILAVAAASKLCDLSLEEISQGLSSCSLPSQRMSNMTIGKYHIIDDSYNSNPLSCSRMIDAASEMAWDNSLVCVLGDMKELGSLAEQEHTKIAYKLFEASPKAIFWRGEYANLIKNILEEKKYSGQFFEIKEVEDFAQDLQKLNIGEAVIIFKASRSVHLEQALKAFVDLMGAENVL